MHTLETRLPPYSALLAVILAIVAALTSGCSTDMVKHELEYQGGKLVVETLRDPKGKEAMLAFLEEHEHSDHFKALIVEIADENMEAWFDQKVGQGVMGGGS